MTPNAAAQAVIFQFFCLPSTCAMHWHRIKRRNKAFLCRTYLLFGIWGRQTCEIFVAYRSRPFSKIQTAVFSLWWCLVGCVAAMRACGRGWSTRSMVLTNQTFVWKVCPIWPIFQTTGEHYLPGCLPFEQIASGIRVMGSTLTLLVCRNGGFCVTKKRWLPWCVILMCGYHDVVHHV